VRGADPLVQTLARRHSRLPKPALWVQVPVRARRGVVRDVCGSVRCGVTHCCAVLQGRRGRGGPRFSAVRRAAAPLRVRFGVVRRGAGCGARVVVKQSYRRPHCQLTFRRLVRCGLFLSGVSSRVCTYLIANGALDCTHLRSMLPRTTDLATSRTHLGNSRNIDPVVLVCAF
jgi:hypothetical protein